MREIEKLLEGFAEFRQEYFNGKTSRFGPLMSGQAPKVMFITCCDSRIDPAILTGSEPGDIFVVRNIAGLVESYEEGSVNSAGAAVEYAVCHLRVNHIVVLGHSGCGGISSLMTGCSGSDEFITRWMSGASAVYRRVSEELAGEDEESIIRCAEMASVHLSLQNLCNYPFVVDRIRQGALALHGWYFDMHTGEIHRFDPRGSSNEISIRESDWKKL